MFGYLEKKYPKPEHETYEQYFEDIMTRAAKLAVMDEEYKKLMDTKEGNKIDKYFIPKLFSTDKMRNEARLHFFGYYLPMLEAQESGAKLVEEEKKKLEEQMKALEKKEENTSEKIT
jgi:hypothetical protein